MRARLRYRMRDEEMAPCGSRSPTPPSSHIVRERGRNARGFLTSSSPQSARYTLAVPHHGLPPRRSTLLPPGGGGSLAFHPQPAPPHPGGCRGIWSQCPPKNSIGNLFRRDRPRAAGRLPTSPAGTQSRRTPSRLLETDNPHRTTATYSHSKHLC